MSGGQVGQLQMTKQNLIASSENGNSCNIHFPPSLFISGSLILWFFTSTIVYSSTIVYLSTLVHNHPHLLRMWALSLPALKTPIHLGRPRRYASLNNIFDHINKYQQKKHATNKELFIHHQKYTFEMSGDKKCVGKCLFQPDFIILKSQS